MVKYNQTQNFKIVVIVMNDHCRNIEKARNKKIYKSSKLSIATVIILVYIYLFRLFFSSISSGLLSLPTGSYFFPIFLLVPAFHVILPLSHGFLEITAKGRSF